MNEAMRGLLLNISIHALRGEGDRIVRTRILFYSRFLSTPSVGRATRTLWRCWRPAKNFYPRPPWGGRRVSRSWTPNGKAISIHALRGEGDRGQWRFGRGMINFYPRPPWGGRLCWRTSTGRSSENFYPRPPWGGRPLRSDGRRQKVKFLSTPSVGRATKLHSLWISSCLFLSTPSVGRATRGGLHRRPRDWHFYPRPPWGGRRDMDIKRPPTSRISIHALRGEGDTLVHTYLKVHVNFYPRPPWGGRRLLFFFVTGGRDFYPRPPWGGRLQKCLKNSCTFVSNHTIGSLIYREILPELQRNRQNNLCFTPKIRCDSPG